MIDLQRLAASTILCDVSIHRYCFQATAMTTRSYRIAPLPAGVTPFTQLLSDHLAVIWDDLFEPAGIREAVVLQQVLRRSGCTCALVAGAKFI